MSYEEQQRLFASIKNRLRTIKTKLRKNTDRHLQLVDHGSGARELQPGESSRIHDTMNESKHRLSELYRDTNEDCRRYAASYNQILLFNVADVFVAAEIIHRAGFSGIIRVHPSVPSGVLHAVEDNAAALHVPLQPQLQQQHMRGRGRGRAGRGGRGYSNSRGGAVNRGRGSGRQAPTQL